MIAIDAGNTSVHFAWYKNNRIVKTAKLAAALVTLKSLEKVLSRDPREELFLCSVVPRFTKLFKKLKRKVYIIGEDIKVPIKCFYDKKTIGADRLVAAFAAKQLYKNTRIIIDFGTAITFDILAKNGSYLGGLILPGLGSTLNVFSGCALLPKKIRIKKTGRLIPRSTQESISKGANEGFTQMINGLVKKYNQKIKLSNNDAIVITGGDAGYLLTGFNFRYLYNPHLVLQGISMLGQEFIENSLF